jgi:UDP-3-O-[3-hydroxymyristoyl] glucosamine N-acyltransferase
MKKEFNLKQISDIIAGKIIGDSEYKITGVKNIYEAGKEDITFAENNYALKQALEQTPGAILYKEQIETENNIIIVENPKYAWTLCIDLFYNEPVPANEISKNAYIDSTAKIGKNVYIGHFSVIEKNAVIKDNAKIYPNCFIGENCIIGETTKLYPGVKLYYDTVLGNNCIIHSNTVIGADGFGFTPTKSGIKKIFQIGNVIIKDNVEIGANTTIDRATTSSTVIGSNVKIDDHVHIAHNCVIGDYTIMTGMVALAGSVKVGKNVTIAGQAAVGPHMTIGNNVTIGGKSGVVTDIPDGRIVSGFPAKEHNIEKRIMISLPRLPEMFKKIRLLFSSVKRISHRLENIEKYLNLKFRKDN